MTLPTEGLPLAAALSPRVQVIESTGSTNADLVRHVHDDPANWPHLSVLVTDDQTAGRGRLDRVWVAPAGAALAVSVVVDASALPPSARGWIPLAAGAAMTRAVAEQVAPAATTVRLKWPNDVLVDGAKICGILAEAVLGHPETVIVGAGVNTAMTMDQFPVPTATSFAAHGLVADVDRLLADYLRALDEQLSALAAAGGDAAASGVMEGVEALCGTLGADIVVSLPDGTVLEGRGRRLDVDGRLVVASPLGTEAVVAAGDVVHVR
ncbi:biotin--[acetyl-CoA-carboxylase] ligase [Microbacterium hominis]|uniref:Biotin--[acetyl-CoA-carboxylase] ligase n=1 Tax=Microbacterium hominis TaxID=162426 RepID=A0A7D4Q8P6_9MICO|nr:biotin--[acetyl-CoA-carboxylase] ligase [Microbacterium hominis]QKJ20039.1 biotin--[acetyl-CoA-carboxylase] ligase [Microbacterium hominis]